MDAISQERKEKLKQIGELDATYKEERKTKKEQQEKRRKKTIAERQKEVEDKLTRGEKLTTEDLLVMQNIDEK